MMNSTAYAPLLHRRAPAALVATLTAAGAIVMAAPVLGQSEPPASCFTDQPGTVGSVDHPTDPDAVVLRMAVGGGFEVMQVFGLVSGTFQWKDLVSNLAGIVAALAPLALGRRGRA